MDEQRKNILVIGATGNQGGAVVRHLLPLEDDFHVHGLSRNVSSARAEKLTERGVTMLQGDLEDKASLARVMEGMDALFLVTNFWTSGYDSQVRQGKNAAEVAADVGVDHVVFSGVGDHENATGIPHFESCWEIDQHLQHLELPTTVLEPVFFFQNFEPMCDDILDGTLAMPLERGVKLQMVDVDDIGKAAAVALMRPGDFIGTRHNLAGDALTLEQMGRILADVVDVDLEVVHVGLDQAREQMGEEVAVMYEWFNERGYSTDLERAHQTFGFEFTRFRDYLHKHGWHVRSVH